MPYDFKAAEGKQIRSVVAELRDTGDEFALVGLAARYDVLSHNMGGFREIIKPGAFKRTLATGPDVKFLFNHEPSNILGRTTSGTLELTEDEKGLRFRCQLNKASQAHRDLYASVKRGDISDCSFAFMVPKGGQSWADGKDPETGEQCAMRTLTDVDLLDASVVTYPAYPLTSASARSQRTDYTTGVSDRDLQHAIATLRKAAQISARELVRELREFSSDGMPYAAMQRCLNRAMELAEASQMCSDLVDDTLAQLDVQDEVEQNSRLAKIAVMRSFIKAHMESHAAISGACESFSRTRLALGRCMK